MRECISHHNACDCREEAHAAEKRELQANLESLQGLYELALEATQDDTRLAEIRGAAWACQWFAAQGLRHNSADPVAICNAARK